MLDDVSFISHDDNVIFISSLCNKNDLTMHSWLPICTLCKTVCTWTTCITTMQKDMNSCVIKPINADQQQMHLRSLEHRFSVLVLWIFYLTKLLDKVWNGNPGFDPSYTALNSRYLEELN